MSNCLLLLLVCTDKFIFQYLLKFIITDLKVTYLLHNLLGLSNSLKVTQTSLKDVHLWLWHIIRHKTPLKMLCHLSNWRFHWVSKQPQLRNNGLLIVPVELAVPTSPGKLLRIAKGQLLSQSDLTESDKMQRSPAVCLNMTTIGVRCAGQFQEHLSWATFPM